MYRIYGFDPEEASDLGTTLQRVHPEDRAKWRETINRAIAEKSDYEVEFRIFFEAALSNTSTRRPSCFERIRDLMEFVGSATDITDASRQ